MEFKTGHRVESKLGQGEVLWVDSYTDLMIIKFEFGESENYFTRDGQPIAVLSKAQQYSVERYHGRVPTNVIDINEARERLRGRK